MNLFSVVGWRFGFALTHYRLQRTQEGIFEAGKATRVKGTKFLVECKSKAEGKCCRRRVRRRPRDGTV